MFELRYVYFMYGRHCEYFKHLIKVRNCSGFYIYYLTSLPCCRCRRFCGYYDSSLSGSASPSTSPLEPTTHVPIKVIIDLKNLIDEPLQKLSSHAPKLMINQIILDDKLQIFRRAYPLYHCWFLTWYFFKFLP